MNHYKDVCACGAVIMQCRCISPDKKVRVVCRRCPACQPPPSAPPPTEPEPVIKENGE